jgi:hypothetical protein
MGAAPLQTLVPETEAGNSLGVITSADDDGRWVDSVPALLREHLLSKIPQDGKRYVVRMVWTVGGV